MVELFFGAQAILARTIGAAIQHVQPGALRGAIIDVGLPDGDGLDLLEQIRRTDATLPALVLTASSDSDVVRRSRKLQARYAFKPAPQPEIADFLMSAVYGPDAFDALIWAAVRRITSRVPQGLTARHEDVLHALALDDRRELVARDLGMSIGTLKSHIGELCDRLGADDARHLGAIVRAEARHGIERLAPNLLSGGLGRQLSLDC